MPMYQSLARDHKLWLSLGGFHEVASRGDNGQCNKVFNTHVVVDHLGKIVALYRKIHLFDVDIPGGAVLQVFRKCNTTNVPRPAPYILIRGTSHIVSTAEIKITDNASADFGKLVT